MIQTEDVLRSVRPFSLDKEMDEDMKEKIMQHLKPLVNVIYTKGHYYIYQAESLLKEPGLTADLAAKTSVDRYFVTSQIKSIAMKASLVVGHTRLIELEKAYEEAKMDSKSLQKIKQPEDSEESFEIEPISQEAKLEVRGYAIQHLNHLLVQFNSLGLSHGNPINRAETANESHSALKQIILYNV